MSLIEMPVIEISDRHAVQTEQGETSRLAFDLRDLLGHLPPELQELNWSILELWAVARDDATPVTAIEAQAAASPTGLRMTGSELWDLAERLLQVIDGIFVAYRDRPPARSDRDLRESSEIVLEAIDSTLWRVYAKDPAVADRVRRPFNDVQEILPETPIRATHEHH